MKIKIKFLCFAKISAIIKNGLHLQERLIERSCKLLQIRKQYVWNCCVVLYARLDHKIFSTAVAQRRLLFEQSLMGAAAR